MGGLERASPRETAAHAQGYLRGAISYQLAAEYRLAPREQYANTYRLPPTAYRADALTRYTFLVATAGATAAPLRAGKYVAPRPKIQSNATPMMTRPASIRVPFKRVTSATFRP